MFLSIFTDELGKDIAEALPIIKSWGLDYVDLRSRIFGKDFSSLEGDELRNLKNLLDVNGMKVGCLQSSLAKVHQPDADRRRAEEIKFDRIIRAADILNCQLVRAFFYWQRYKDGRGALAIEPDQQQKTLDLFTPLARRMKEAGLVVGFENCGATPDEVLTMLDLLGVREWGLAWDPHNNWNCDERRQDEDTYINRMITHANMIHVKATQAVEGLSRKLIPYDRILAAFFTGRKNGPVSIETHNPNRTVSNEEMSRRTVVAIQRSWPEAATGRVQAQNGRRSQ